MGMTTKEILQGVHDWTLQKVVYDISAAHPDGQGNPRPYADLTAALDSNNGGGVPQSLQKGGMRVQFIQGTVQSSDNNYVQFRCIADEFTTDTTQWVIADEGVYVENPEFVRVVLDNENKILWAIKKDGSIYYGAGVPQQVIDYIEDRIKELSLDEYEDIVAFLQDYLGGDTTLKSIIDNLSNTKVDKVTGKSLIDAEYATGISYIDNPEFTVVYLDHENKVISAIDKNGWFHAKVGIETKALSIGGLDIRELIDKSILKNDIKKFDLPKFGYVNFIDETFYLTYNSNISSKDDVYVIQDLADTDANANAKLTIAFYYLKSSLMNNGDGTYSKYNDGVSGHDVKLDFYAAGDVKNVSGIWYVSSTLVDGQPTQDSVRVTEISDVPDVRTWSVDKSTKHHCTISIDFGSYMSGTYSVEVKFQGSSTLGYRKRNFRFTFYKNSTYQKKLKVKLGELIRQSGYNLKANATDDSKLKEFVMNRLFIAMWDAKEYYSRYPWNDADVNTPYSGATGLINGFPVKVSIGGEFYGLHILGLKKDAANYLIEDDAHGIFVCAEAAGWSTAHASTWVNEIEDEMPIDTAEALDNFFTFINTRFKDGNNHTYKYSQVTLVNDVYYVTSTLVDGQPVESSVEVEYFDYTRTEAADRMYVLLWIDYIIGLQVFFMPDNIGRNMILYSNEAKHKFAPFFYDLDLSWNFPSTNEGISRDIFTYEFPAGTFERDRSVYINFMNVYWDDVVGRYRELRKSVLSDSYITTVIDDIVSNIPDDVFYAESNRWGNNKISKECIYDLLYKLKKRLVWLDTFYFNK